MRRDDIVTSMPRGARWPFWLFPALAACSTSHDTSRPTWTTAELAAQQRCEGGQVAACGELGRSLVADGRALRDVQRGLVLLEGACGGGDMHACAALGIWYSTHGKDENNPRATELLTRACDRQVAEGCRGLARLIGQKPMSEATTEDLGRIEQLSRTGCDLGDARACTDAGALAGARGERGWADQERLYGRACALRLPDGCHLLAMHHLADRATVDQGVAELLRNCGGGHDPSCLQAAETYAPGIGERPSCTRARPLAVRACLAKLDDGCVIVDACAEGTTRDAEAARLRTACDRHNALACFYWAESQFTADPGSTEQTYASLCRGRSRSRPAACSRLALIRIERATNSADIDEPLDDLRRLCDRAVPTACCTLADVYANGRFVPPDADEAARARSKTCPSCCDPP